MPRKIRSDVVSSQKRIESLQETLGWAVRGDGVDGIVSGDEEIRSSEKKGGLRLKEIL